MDLIPVTDLKQWAYCPRIVFYHRFMPGAAQATYKMREAVQAQEMIERLELRRSLEKYGFDRGERYFGRWLSDAEMGISGRVDLLLSNGESAAVVDYKLTSGEPGENHRFQLGGYALLAERELGVPVGVTFLYRIPDGEVFEIRIDADLRRRVMEAIREIGRMKEAEWYPPMTAVRGRCVECEYANLCGDVW